MWKYVLFGQELVNRGKCANTAFGSARTSPTLLKDQMAIVIFSWILSNVSALHRTGKKELSDQERRKPAQNLSFKAERGKKSGSFCSNKYCQLPTIQIETHFFPKLKQNMQLRIYGFAFYNSMKLNKNFHWNVLLVFVSALPRDQLSCPEYHELWRN